MTIKVGEETYYSEEYVKELKEENKKQKEVLDKIKEYIKRKNLVNRNEITNGNIKYILELLEEIE